MFGYVKINKMELTFREYEHYRGFYCGLCKTLKDNHSEISRLSLNYDMTFLVILLSSIYDPQISVIEEGCIVNPLKKKKKIKSDVTDYCANMNILLSYSKLEDNVIDDNKLKDKIIFNIYKKNYKKPYELYEYKANFIKEKLTELQNLEKQDCRNIDLVSNIFGHLMGEIFAYQKDKNEKILRKIGFNIGKYIYILDAFEDLDKDIKKNRYNPFKDYKDKKQELIDLVDFNIKISLSMLSKNIENLDIKKNISIIENIIYSGIYIRYKNILNKGCEINE
ncbi:MAG: DUF5685 family protein [Peptostreptococcaceae bacterium]